MTGSNVLRAKSSRFPIPREEWSHLAVTFNGSRIRLYVNGVLAASTTDIEVLAEARQLELQD